MPPVHSTHPNVTPLIDVVMCLIIFYMLVAKIGIDTGQDLRIQLPISLQGIKLTDMGNTATLNVDSPSFGDEPNVTALDPRSGEKVMLKLIDGANQPLKAFLQLGRQGNSEFKVIIRSDQNLAYRFLEPVLRVCNDVKVRNVNFATREPNTH
jgi:biopolymer transport protein ExbD